MTMEWELKHIEKIMNISMLSNIDWNNDGKCKSAVAIGEIAVRLKLYNANYAYEVAIRLSPTFIGYRK